MARKRVYQGGGGANSHAPQTGCVPPSQRSRNLQCQRIFQVNAPINCVCLHPNQVRGLPGAGHPGALEGRVLPGLTSLVPPQAELIVGDQSGAIHIWDLKTDHNEQLIPEPEVSITSAHIDPDASYMAAVNSTVSPGEGVQPRAQLFRTLFPAGGLSPLSPASPFWALALTQPPEPEPWGSRLMQPLAADRGPHSSLGLSTSIVFPVVHFPFSSWSQFPSSLPTVAAASLTSSPVTSPYPNAEHPSAGAP